MASSSGSVSDAPGTGTRTPTGNQQAPSASALAAAASELSPPGSQPHKIAHMPPLHKVKTTDASPVKTAKKTSEVPIGEWRSKRSQEEYQRAYDSVIHKDFNLGMSIWRAALSLSLTVMVSR